jgi:hypothetical protein
MLQEKGVDDVIQQGLGKRGDQEEVGHCGPLTGTRTRNKAEYNSVNATQPMEESGIQW